MTKREIEDRGFELGIKFSRKMNKPEMLRILHNHPRYITENRNNIINDLLI